MKTIRKGDKGDEVKQLQEYLKQLICIDGNFDDATHNTVIQFQTKMDLVADGIVGTKTWNALEKEVAKLKQPKSEIQYDAGLEGKDLLSKELLDLFGHAGHESKNPTIYVTSMWRSPAKQASVMYDNIVQGAVISYAEPGRIVTQLIQAEIKKKTPKAQVVQLAEAKIIELAQQNKLVSKHCITEAQYQKMNVIDISKTRTPNPRDLAKALLKETKVSRIITPFGELSTYGNDKRVLIDANEPAIHIEYTV